LHEQILFKYKNTDDTDWANLIMFWHLFI